MPARLQPEGEGLYPDKIFSFPCNIALQKKKATSLSRKVIFLQGLRGGTSDTWEQGG